MLQALNCTSTYTAIASCALTTWAPGPNALFPPLMFALICWLKLTRFATNTTWASGRYNVDQHLLLRNVYTNQLYKAFEWCSMKHHIYLYIFYYNSDWHCILYILWLAWKQVVNHRKMFSLLFILCYFQGFATGVQTLFFEIFTVQTLYRQ